MSTSSSESIAVLWKHHGFDFRSLDKDTQQGMTEIFETAVELFFMAAKEPIDCLRGWEFNNRLFWEFVELPEQKLSFPSVLSAAREKRFRSRLAEHLQQIPLKRATRELLARFPIVGEADARKSIKSRSRAKSRPTRKTTSSRN